MTQEPRKPFPLKPLSKALFFISGWIEAACLYRNNEKLNKELAKHQPPHVVPCETWVESIEAEDQRQSRRE
jgi:hypothetical protein